MSLRILRTLAPAKQTLRTHSDAPMRRYRAPPLLTQRAELHVDFLRIAIESYTNLDGCILSVLGRVSDSGGLLDLGVTRPLVARANSARDRAAADTQFPNPPLLCFSRDTAADVVPTLPIHLWGAQTQILSATTELPQIWISRNLERAA